MSKVTAEEIKRLSKSVGGNAPHKQHVEAVLDWVGTDEHLLWCANYVDMDKKFGSACLLVVTDRRIVVQRFESAFAKKPAIYEIALDSVVSAVDLVKPVMLGLMKNHHLVIEATSGRVVIQDMADAVVGSAAAAINGAKLGN